MGGFPLAAWQLPLAHSVPDFCRLDRSHDPLAPVGRIDRPAPADLAAARHARRATAVPTMRSLDDQGRVLITRAMRTQLGMAPGDELLVTGVTSHDRIAVADPTVVFDAAPLSPLDVPRIGPRTAAECSERLREFR